MTLFDHIFPEQAQALHLRDIAERIGDATRASQAREIDESNNAFRIAGLERRLKQLEDDSGLLALLLAVVMKKLCEKTDLTYQDVLAEVAAVDASDGKADGRLDVAALRALLGLPQPDVAVPGRDQVCADCRRVMLNGRTRCLYCGGLAATG